MAKNNDLYEQLGAVMRGRKVRDAQRRVANQISSRAKSIAASEAPGTDIDRDAGVRPGTHSPKNVARPYERISAPADQEHGTANIARRRILGRAVESL